MIQLNILAVMKLTYLFLPEMNKRKSGHIVNIASTEGFVPVCGQSVYAASKAFITSFSQALYEECKHSGVTVSTICPGVTKTSFYDNVNLKLKFFKTGDPDEFAKFAYRAMNRNKALAVHRFSYRVITLWARLYPRAGVRRLSGRICN